MALSSMLKLVPVLLATYILRPADRQWGNVSAGSGTTFTFPISFRKTVIGIIGDHYGTTNAIVHFRYNNLSSGAVFSSVTSNEPIWSYYIVYGV